MKVKVTVTATDTIELDSNQYEDEWREFCDERGHDEDEDYPEVDKAWLLEKYQEDLEDGTYDLSEALEGATIEVKEA